MAKVLNLGKVVGPAGKDGTINGLNKVTIEGANGINVTTSSEGGL